MSRCSKLKLKMHWLSKAFNNGKSERHFIIIKLRAWLMKNCIRKLREEFSLSECETKNESYFGQILVDTNSWREIINKLGYPARQVPNRLYYWQGSYREPMMNYDTVVFYSYMCKRRQKWNLKMFTSALLLFALSVGLACFKKSMWW